VEGRVAINRLAFARLISQTGTIAAFTTLAYHLYALTGSPIWQSAGILAAVSVGGVAQPIAGVLADRVDRRRLMIASDAAGALVSLALAPLVDVPVALVALVALGALVESPFAPASRAAIPNLIDAEQLAWANGRISAAGALGFVLGPAFAAVLLAGPGARGVFVASAITFTISAALVTSLRGASFRAAPVLQGPDAGGAGAGLRAIRRDHALTLLLLGEVVAFSGIGIAITADAPIAKLFHQTQFGYAAMLICWGLGSLVASVVTGRIMRRGREARWLVGGMATLGLGCVVIGVAPIWVIVLVGNLVGGVGMGANDTSRQTLVQRRVDDDVAGRVFAALEFASVGALALGTALAGPILDALGSQWPYTICGITFVLGALIQIGLLRLPPEPAELDGATVALDRGAS
jgi:MFS family permease